MYEKAKASVWNNADNLLCFPFVTQVHFISTLPAGGFLHVWKTKKQPVFPPSFMYFLCNIFSKEVASRESLMTLPTALLQLPICMRLCVSVHHLQQAAPTCLLPRTARARLTFAYWVIGHWCESIMEFSLTWFIPGLIHHEEEGHGTKSLTSYR